VVDAGLLWRNLALVLATSVLPFPTSVLGLAFQQGTRRDETAALILYAAVAASVSATWFEVFDYLSRNLRLLEADTSPEFFRGERRRSMVGIVLYSFAAAVANWAPLAGLAILVALLVFYGVTLEGQMMSRRRPRKNQP